MASRFHTLLLPGVILLFACGWLSGAEAPKKKGSSMATEINLEASYVGGSKTRLAGARWGDVSEQASSIQYVVSPQLNESTLLRVGGAWERFSFGLPDAVPLPNTIQSANLVTGADFELSDEWLLRVEAHPGVYSDFQDISLDDFNIPTIAGVSYLVNKDLQWFFGVSIDPRRDIPVLPGAGVRWKFADQWTLMFLLPKPRLNFELNEKVTLFAGADIKGGTYKVSKHFGDNHGRAVLNNASVDFTEFRIGPGIVWKALPGIEVNLEGGYMIYRSFDYSDADLNFRNDPAPYGQVSVVAKF